MEPKEAQKRNIRLKVFSSLYDDRIAEDHTLSTLSLELGLHPERIRQLQNGEENTIGVEASGQLLNGLIQSEDFIVNPVLQMDYMQFSSSSFFAEKEESFDARLGIVDRKTKAFLMATLDLHLANSSRYIEPFVIKGENVTFINRVFGSVMKFFTEEVSYVSLEKQLLPFLIKRTDLDYNDEAVNVILDIVRHSDLFEEKTIGGEVLYALRWQHLMSVPSRLARVLYDMGEPTHYLKVYEEYNRRAASFGLTEERIDVDFIRRVHPHIRSKGKTGIWVFSKNHEIENNKSLLDELKQFVSMEGGVVSESDLLRFARSQEFVINERTLRAYLSQICRKMKSNPPKYILRETLESHPEVEVYNRGRHDTNMIITIALNALKINNGRAELGVIKRKYYEETGRIIRNSALLKQLKNEPDMVINERGRGQTMITKESELLESRIEGQARMSQSNRSPAYYKQVERAIRTYLLSAENHCAKLSEVIDKVKDLIPHDHRKNILYRIIPRMEGIIVYEVGEKKFLRIKPE